MIESATMLVAENWCILALVCNGQKNHDDCMRRSIAVRQCHLRRANMAGDCTHMDGIRDVTPSALGCEECLRSGDVWLHLRLCRTCGHVGCCDESPNRHATKHFHATGHPVIEGYDPPEGWGWCYVDDAFLDLSDRATPQNGPIPRYY